jgi:hypothetical protein
MPCVHFWTDLCPEPVLAPLRGVPQPSFVPDVRGFRLAFGRVQGGMIEPQA